MATKENKPYESVLPRKYVKALRKVQEHILENPKSFKMETWGDVEASKNNTCNTVGCICGWMAILSAPKAQVKPVLRYEEKIAIRDLAALSSNTDEEYRKHTRDLSELERERDLKELPTLSLLVKQYQDEIPSEFRRDFDKLFFLEEWPKKFRKLDKSGYSYTTTPKKAVARIDYYLEHGR